MRGVLITEKSYNPDEIREKTTQMLFEAFNVSNAYLANDLVLSLYNSGRTTGLSVDIGASQVQCVGVYEVSVNSILCLE